MYSTVQLLEHEHVKLPNLNRLGKMFGKQCWEKRMLSIENKMNLMGSMIYSKKKTTELVIVAHLAEKRHRFKEDISVQKRKQKTKIKNLIQ